ncbi:MAG: SGNH/GDSL hydrolase family protein [Vicinamibacteria bacterium]
MRATLSQPARLFLAALVVLLARRAAAEGFYLREGDRVVFYGDSITEGRRYTEPIEWFVATRFPSMKVSFVHSGVGGDTVAGGWAGTIDRRLERDVLAYKPTVLTIMLGMNDAGYKAFDQAAFDAYSAGYHHIVARVQKALPGIRITLIEPSPFDDVTRPPNFPDGYDAVLRRYGRFVSDLGAERGCLVVDFGAPLVAALERVNSANALLARQLIPDRVHPAESGSLVMAAALLRAWGASNLVSSVEIDAAAGEVRHQEGTVVSDVAKTAGGVTWTALDASLPLPLEPSDATVQLAELAGAGLLDLGQVRVRVTGLPEGRFTLKIDGDAVGPGFAGAELAEGIDLSRFESPLLWQARHVRWTTSDHTEARAMRLKLLVKAPRDSNTPAAARLMERLDAEAVKARREETRPKPRRFEIAVESP